MFHITDPLVTDRLLLRPFRAGDLEDLYAIQSRPDVVRYLYWNVRTREEVWEVLQHRMRQTALAAEGDMLSLAVVLAEDGGSGPVIGDISFWWRSVPHRQGEIGYVFHPAYGGQGYAAEAVAAVFDLLFRALHLHRIYGRTDARNVASAALMRRLGMRQEAHLVENEIFKGEWSDELIFAVLEREWHERQSTPSMHLLEYPELSQHNA